MLRHAYIIRFLSGFLLIVFALSITPKRFLHDLFAKHIDNRPGKSNDKAYHLSNAGYNCDNDNLVAESSFASSQQIFSFPVFTSVSSFIFHHNSFPAAFGIYSLLRGPPANV